MADDHFFVVVFQVFYDFRSKNSLLLNISVYFSSGKKKGRHLVLSLHLSFQCKTKIIEIRAQRNKLREQNNLEERENKTKGGGRKKN